MKVEDRDRADPCSICGGDHWEADCLQTNADWWDSAEPPAPEIICAWCGRFLGFAYGCKERSHGICRPCAQKLLEEKK